MLNDSRAFLIVKIYKNMSKTRALNSIIDFNKREFHWIYKGLEIYLVDKYIKSYYPRAKFFGYALYDLKQNDYG